MGCDYVKHNDALLANQSAVMGEGGPGFTLQLIFFCQ